MRWSTTLLMLSAALLLGGMLGSSPKVPEAPWREGGWTGAFAVPRPALPGRSAWLEAAGPIPTGVRLRIHRVEDPQAFLARLLAAPVGEPAVEGARAGMDPLDILREAFLWGGRRAFVTVHRTASRALRDAARGAGNLRRPLQSATAPREGGALPLEKRPGLAFVTEVVPRVTEEITSAPGSNREEDGHLSRIELPAQAAGVYLVELLRDDEAAYVPWLVTDLALLGEQDGARLRVRAVSARDGAPMGGVSGKLFEGTASRPLSFDGGGEAQVPASPGVRRVVLAQAGPSLALMASEGQGAASVRQRLYANTERPLYRPGQEVFAKAVLRTVEGGENRVPRGLDELAFTVLDPEDTKVAEGKARLLSADTCTFGASVVLPGAGRLGAYRWVFQGPQGPAQAEFKVEQFVKPAYAVAVTAAAPKVGLGDPMAFKVAARYFYGAAVRKAKAEWFLYRVVNRQAGWWDPEEDEGPAPELMESGELTLDEDGGASSPVFKAAGDGVYRFVVKVTDGSGQRNAGSAQVRAAAGDMVLFVGTDRSVALPGKPFRATARAADLEGRELKGVPITLRAARIVAEKESAHWWARTSALKPGETLASAQGPSAPLTIPEGGVYLVVAEALDAKGRRVTAQCMVTVAAEGTPLPSVPDLRASADKAQYAAGETARILVRLPRPRLTLHWTVESEGLARRQARKVEGTTALVEIPVTAELQPNAWAVFEVVSEGRRQLAEVPIRAPRADRRLQVEVAADRDAYQPGQPMRIDVRVKDHQGRPAAADLSVGVVDEAIYALSPELHPDIVRFFNPTRRHAVLRTGSTEWSFWDILRRQRPAWSLRQTRRGEFKSDDADKIRQNFKDTAHWVPFLAAGPDGRASTQLVLPDNLTAWRTTATAVASDTRTGVGRDKRTSSKPLQVSLTLPRSLSLGEEARAVAQVRNLSGKPLRGRIWLEAANGSLGGKTSASFDLPDQGEHRLSLPLSAAATGALTVTAHVEGGGLKDAERRTVTVADPLVPASVSGYIRLQGGATTVDIPAPAGASGEASLVVTPVGSLEQLAAPSLPYLIAYPYGCVEQTLSSFMPNLRIADLAKRGRMPGLEWRKLVDLDRNIRDGVFRVYGYQMPNGGWGWYAPGDFGLEANPHTTGYAIQSFAAMRALGYAVDEGVRRRGAQAAFSLFRECAREADLRRPGAPVERGRATDPAGDAAFLLQALASAGEPVAGLVEATAAKVLAGKWRGGHVAAMAAQAAVTSRHPRAGALLDHLERAASTAGGLAHWEGSRQNWLDWNSGDIFPTVSALKALLEGRPASPLVPQGEAWLATRFQGHGWESTWTTAQVLDLLPLLASTRKLEWKPTGIQASVEGGPSWDFAAQGPELRRWGSKEPRPGYLPLPAAKPLRLTASGHGVVAWTYAYQVPGSAAPQQAAASGAVRLSLKRGIWALASPQATGNARKGWIRRPWTGTLAMGEEAWMELEVQGDREASYAILEVPIPAGLVPNVKLEGFVLEGRAFTNADASDTWWDKPRVEVHPDRVTFLWQKLYPWDTQRVRILLRAGMAGEYRIRPARLSLMSNEACWITCDGLRLAVKEGGAR